MERDDDRRTGRTTEMLMAMLAELFEGQPKCIVVGADARHVLDLINHTRSILRNMVGLTPKIIGPNLLQVFEGQTVEFLSAYDIAQRQRLCGAVGSQYLDHYASERHPELNTTEPFCERWGPIPSLEFVSPI